MNNLPLIRKIAWSFHKTTGLELDELFAEASLAYCLGLQKYDPTKGKITTFMWMYINNHLRNYLHKHNEYQHPLCPLDGIDKAVEYPLTFEELSREAQQIAELIFATPTRYACAPRKTTYQRLISVLRNNGWDWHRICCGLHDLRLAFQ